MLVWRLYCVLLGIKNPYILMRKVYRENEVTCFCLLL
nr:MAG TPA: hypothetical protein [Caudoviricetes sp.]